MAKEQDKSFVGSPLPALGAPPANIEEWQADRERRKRERDAKRPRLMECLDPEVAKYWEDRKDVWEWQLQIEMFRPATGKQRAHRETITRKVVAQTQQEAWAVFCDSIGEWPSFRDSQVTIKKLRKRTLSQETEETAVA
jgi:hypothetical protein